MTDDTQHVAEQADQAQPDRTVQDASPDGGSIPQPLDIVGMLLGLTPDNIFIDDLPASSQRSAAGRAYADAKARLAERLKEANRLVHEELAITHRQYTGLVDHLRDQLRSSQELNSQRAQAARDNQVAVQSVTRVALEFAVWVGHQPANMIASYAPSIYGSGTGTCALDYGSGREAVFSYVCGYVELLVLTPGQRNRTFQTGSDGFNSEQTDMLKTLLSDRWGIAPSGPLPASVLRELGTDVDRYGRTVTGQSLGLGSFAVGLLTTLDERPAPKNL